MGDSEVVDVDEVHAAVGVLQGLTIDMISLSEVEVEVILNVTSLITEEEVKIPLEAKENSGMEISIIIGKETTGKDKEMVKVMQTGDDDGMVIEVKVIVTGDEEGDGTQTPIINNKITNNHINTLIQIIIVHLLWVINIDIQYPMTKVPVIHHNLPNISHNRGDHNPTKPQTYVNCVKIKVIMIINVNLQANSWQEHRRPLIKGDPTVTKR